jgi:hypothetical protein
MAPSVSCESRELHSPSIAAYNEGQLLWIDPAASVKRREPSSIVSGLKTFRERGSGYWPALKMRHVLGAEAGIRFFTLSIRS